MKRYILFVRNIYIKDEAYGPYESEDAIRFHLYQIYGDDWNIANFEIVELKYPYELEEINLKKP